ncbi:hypothetical protein CSUB01_00636 [Colletotrichum sublineola]|uniref:NADH-ubiquinone reductase complex 1 MLRQ subunit n=1 Tax=Colletotrichum sublineola TaxID=1173701 RepID=A0A066XIV8_COLSU|nr:hypothetical protein CSUB01_00636 [Colletotrichum sublineola]
MRPSLALRAFRPTMRKMSPVPAEDQVGTSTTRFQLLRPPVTRGIDPDDNLRECGRLRKLRQIPPELIPLGVVVGFALTAATYSIARHFMTDKTIRLKRQGKSAAAESGHEEGH